MRNNCILLIFTLLINHFCNGQNLIKNNSFEDSIPTLGWFENYAFCNLASNVSFFKNSSKNNTKQKINFRPQDGETCVKIELFFREVHGSTYYITHIPKLKKGTRYDFSFYITSDDSCGYSVKNIDALFCNENSYKNNVSCIQPFKMILEPTISFDIGSLKKEGQEGNWIKLENFFVSKGNENLMVIGNFSDPDKIKYYFKKNPHVKKKLTFSSASAFYYLDNFSLTEIKK